jgi:hypothetical protein
VSLIDLAVRAYDGSALIKGDLGIYAGADNKPVRHASSASMIGVQPGREPYAQTTFSIFDQFRRGADGFYSTARPILTIYFDRGLADPFARLGPNFRGGRHQIKVEGLPLLSVSFEEPDRPAESRFQWASGDALDMRLTREPDGLRIAFESMLRPGDHVRDPVFSEARLVGDLVLPRAWCLLQPSPLSGLFYETAGPTTGRWAPLGHRDGLGAIAVGRFGTLFCPGMLDLKEKVSWASSAGPWVRANIAAHETCAMAVGNLDRLENGYAQEARYRSDGPELRLLAGYEDWEQMLNGAEEATAHFTGAGIGWVDGVTGRDAYEDPERQKILALNLHLKRTKKGLLVTGDGVFAPLASGKVSLGPEFSFKWLVPRAWILARGLPLTGFFRDREKEYPDAGTW